MRLCSITVHSYTDLSFHAEYGIVSQCGTECMQFSGYDSDVHVTQLKLEDLYYCEVTVPVSSDSVLDS